MIVRTSIALMSLLVCAVPTALATDTSPLCTKARVAGSYIHQRDDLFIDQVTLHNDGTAYFSQSPFFDHFVTFGATMPQTGTWKCVDGDTLVATLISTNFRSEAVDDPLHIGEVVSDVGIDSWLRTTFRFNVQTKNRLERNFIVFKSFVLTDNPLSSASVPFEVGSSDTPRLYYRVPVVTSDLP